MNENVFRINLISFDRDCLQFNEITSLQKLAPNLILISNLNAIFKAVISDQFRNFSLQYF
jgi:hypothetical protein